MSPITKRMIFSFLTMIVVAGALLYHSTPSHAAASPATTKTPSTVYVGDGNSEYVFNISDGSLRWSFPTSGEVNTTSVVANGVLYFGAEYASAYSGVLFALNASDGSILWHSSMPPFGYFSSPAIANGVVYIAYATAYENILYAFNALNGSMLWSFPLGGNTGFSLAPSVVNNILYMGSGEGEGTTEGSMYALNASTGALIWQYTLPSTSSSWVSSSALVVNGVVYFGGGVYNDITQLSNLYALDANTGSLLWQTQEIGPSSQISYVNGILYFSANSGVSGVVYALSATDGSIIWSHGGDVMSPPVVGTYKTLVGFGRYLTALATKAGLRGKSYRVGEIRAPLVLFHKVVYFMTYDTGKLYAFDFQTWTPIWVVTIGSETDSAPTLA